MSARGVHTKLDEIYNALLALLYPQACALCASSVEMRACAPVCERCWSHTRLRAVADQMCWKCGAATYIAVADVEVNAIRCRRCDGEPWTAARSVGAYEGALRAVVLELKHRPFVGDKTIDLLCQWLRVTPLDAATVIMPVPLHPRREQERGFNQAAVLAQRLARRARLRFDDASLIRATYTEAHRAGMDAEGRRASVAGAFEVARPRLIAGEGVLLVDDVWTTGATASACAAPLLEAGARDVYVLTLARAGIS